MNLILPDGMPATDAGLIDVPETLRSRFVGLPDRQCFAAGSGFLLLQRFHCAMFEVCCYDLVRETESVVVMYPDLNQAVMHYLAEGEITIIADAFELNIVPQRYLFYLQTAGQRVSICCKPGATRMICVYPSPSYLLQLRSGALLFGNVIGQSKINNSVRPITREMEGLLKFMTFKVSGEDVQELLIQSCIPQLMHLHVKLGKREDGGRYVGWRFDKAVAEVRQYLDDHLDEELNSPMLARKAGMSASTLEYLFRRKYNTTIHTYVMHKRMETAMELIVGTNRPIGEIAALVSPQAFSNFVRGFKNYFGHSPLYFRLVQRSDDKK
jgi:AraC-like DNA-binding protein